jgi:hypothetical protein
LKRPAQLFSHAVSLSRVPALTTTRTSALVAEVRDQVVHDAAALVEHAAVERLARILQLRDVVREQMSAGSRARARR